MAVRARNRTAQTVPLLTLGSPPASVFHPKRTFAPSKSAFSYSLLFMLRSANHGCSSDLRIHPRGASSSQRRLVARAAAALRRDSRRRRHAWRGGSAARQEPAECLCASAPVGCRELRGSLGLGGRMGAVRPDRGPARRPSGRQGRTACCTGRREGERRSRLSGNLQHCRSFAGPGAAHVQRRARLALRSEKRQQRHARGRTALAK